MSIAIQVLYRNREPLLGSSLQRFEVSLLVFFGLFLFVFGHPCSRPLVIGLVVKDLRPAGKIAVEPEQSLLLLVGSVVSPNVASLFFDQQPAKRTKAVPLHLARDASAVQAIGQWLVAGTEAAANHLCLALCGMKFLLHGSSLCRFLRLLLLMPPLLLLLWSSNSSSSGGGGGGAWSCFGGVRTRRSGTARSRRRIRGALVPNRFLRGRNPGLLRLVAV
mmetsp:Transcript_16796/g.46099  ORF Transcript_16796/g.46099 Transcript_16796/m.46099 type:complete len:219 (-) Transcript_16796:550-1206(-)